MGKYFLVYVMLVSRVCTVVPDTSSTPRTPDDALADSSEEPPEGYYAFVESPNATPPRVRPPPYKEVGSECPSVGETRPHVTAQNLCGDLNRGLIPRNPMGQNVTGRPYPFEVIRNQTLRFLSRTLPVLRADDTLPKVAHLPTLPNRDTEYDHVQDNRLERSARALPLETEIPSEELPLEHRAGDEENTPRESRKFCDNDGVFCMLYRAINGEGSSGPAERREDPGTPHPAHTANTPPRYEGPPTPCPARVEYATPVFARNYQGVWRYVVQIPYEGYFTQTVEVTRCMQSRCHYLAGGCLSSPRWVSLLVAELHYPQPQPHTQPQPSPADFQDYQQYLQKRAGVAGAGLAGAGGDEPHCDGHDQLGCYQVRLYYDWFLVPGSCKCWRPDYFERYVRRRQNEL